MSTTIHQHRHGGEDIHVDHERATITLKQHSRGQGNITLEVSLAALPELISALQEELNFLRPPVTVGKHTVGTHGTDPNQGQLFDPDDYS